MYVWGKDRVCYYLWFALSVEILEYVSRGDGETAVCLYVYVYVSPVSTSFTQKVMPVRNDLQPITSTLQFLDLSMLTCGTVTDLFKQLHAVCCRNVSHFIYSSIVRI